jgi:uncharacterized protein YkwD
MTMRISLAAAALLAACGTVAIGSGLPAGTAPGSPTPSAPSAGASPVAEMAALVNRHRASAGCPPLAWLEAAARAAQAHSDDMWRRGYVGHVSPEGVGYRERLEREGVAFPRGGENIAMHPGTPAEVLAGWVASPGHRENLDDCAYTHHGIGARGGYWTHVFATPAG